MTREELLDKWRYCRGQGAEWVVFGHSLHRRSDYLARITDLAAPLINRYGMSEKLGHVAPRKEQRGYVAAGFMAMAMAMITARSTADAVDRSACHHRRGLRPQVALLEANC